MGGIADSLERPLVDEVLTLVAIRHCEGARESRLSESDNAQLEKKLHLYSNGRRAGCEARRSGVAFETFLY